MFKWLRKIPYFEAFRAFLEQWGLWGWVVSVTIAFAGSIYAWSVWFFDAVPLWAVPLVLLIFITLAVMTIYYGVLVKTWFRAHRMDLPKFGNRLIDFATRFSRAVNDYDRQIENLAVPTIPKDKNDGYQDWARGIAASKRKSAMISETYGGEIVYIFKELARLGIPIPFHLSSSIEYSAAGLSAYLVYVGKMLKEGRLQELKDPDKDTDWTVSNLFR